jgi:hypothetical protein
MAKGPIPTVEEVVRKLASALAYEDDDDGIVKDPPKIYQVRKLLRSLKDLEVKAVKAGKQGPLSTLIRYVNRDLAAPKK